MSELVKERTPQVIAAEINSYKESGRRIRLTCVVEIGRRMPEAKALLPHGEWGKCLQEYGQIIGVSPEGEDVKSSSMKMISIQKP